MVLYHFCAKPFLPGILREGLTKGGTPIIEGGMMRLQMGQQWWLQQPAEGHGNA